MKEISNSGSGGSIGSWIMRILFRSILIAVPLLVLYFLGVIWLPKCWTCWDRGTVKEMVPCVSCDGGVCDVVCASCNGSGKISNDKPCQTCKGSGRIKKQETCSRCRGSVYVDIQKDCRFCNGSGKIPHKRQCTFCNGGTVPCVSLNCDNGNCKECGGDGKTGIPWVNEKPCTVCNATGKCRKCKGYVKVDCPECSGSGFITEMVPCTKCKDGKISERIVCPSCRGKGVTDSEEQCRDCGGDGIRTLSSPCKECHGTGKVKGECQRCGGDGKVEVEVPCPDCKGQKDAA